MTSPFFQADEPALSACLQSYLDWLAEEVHRLPERATLLLAGGYGRGEGGVFYPEDGTAPRLYNDLEFYLFTSSSRHPFLSHWVEEGEKRLHIEVEFKALSPGAFRRARPSMFYYDLLQRHVLVAGPASWLQKIPPCLREASAIPPEEAGRLLVNRGMSLLRCRRWARGERELPPDFADRIVAKLQLALADAVLCLQGLYHWSCEERHRRLTSPSAPSLAPTDNGGVSLPEWSRLVAWHEEGVQFKFRPHRSHRSPEDWQPLLAELTQAWVDTFLWCESTRLHRTFTDPASYSDLTDLTDLTRPQAGRRFPEENPLRNLLRGIRDLRSSVRLPWAGLDHPRAHLWRALVWLMQGGLEAEKQAARCLGRPDLRGSELEEWCRACWQRYP